MAKFLVGILVYLFPKEVIAKMLVILLRNLASLTSNTLDDDIVSLVEKNLGLGVKDE